MALACSTHTKDLHSEFDASRTDSERAMEPNAETQAARWAWIEQLAAQLSADRDLAEAFERTPGKIAGQVGIPSDAIESVLALLSRRDDVLAEEPQNGAPAERPAVVSEEVSDDGPETIDLVESDVHSARARTSG